MQDTESTTRESPNGSVHNLGQIDLTQSIYDIFATKIFNKIVNEIKQDIIMENYDTY